MTQLEDFVNAARRKSVSFLGADGEAIETSGKRKNF
jgi:hypothetical protein